jgi:RNA polymerase sigma factor (sigma-70 family)
MVFNIAYDILNDFHLSEDCAQETFLDAYTGLHTLRNPDSLGSWLWGIARRKALLALSRNRKWSDTVDFADFADILPDLNSTPEDAVLLSELRDSIQSAFKNLSDKNRIVAEFYFLHGVRTPEIARKLKIPVGTVTYRLSEARNKLKGELKAMQEPTKKTLSPDFEKTIMEKVEKLNSYYKDHGSMDGIADAIVEAEASIQKLPDGKNKRSAYANIHRHWYFNIEKTDEQYQKALEAAEKAGDGECLFKLFYTKYWQMWDDAPEAELMAFIDEAIIRVEKLGYAEGVSGLLNNKYDKLHHKLHSKTTGVHDIITFLNDDAIPRMEKFGYSNGVGECILRIGSTLSRHRFIVWRKARVCA